MPDKKPAKSGKPTLLTGGNPQIAKAEGDAPVQAYIAALPGWKRDIGRRLDALIVRTVPAVRKAVKWNSPLYGVEGQGWFLGLHVFTNYLKVGFFKGTSLRPVPPGGRSEEARWVDIHESDLDEKQLTEWIRQAAAIPGWSPNRVAAEPAGGKTPRGPNGTGERERNDMKQSASKKGASATGGSKPGGSKPGASKTSGSKKSAASAGESPSKLIDARIKEFGDWRGQTLGRLRALVKAADPDVVEEWKWNVPVWSHAGLICTGEVYKAVVKMTFAKGATLPDPAGLFNSSLEGNTRRAIDVREGESIDEKGLKTLIRAAVALNKSLARAQE